jgi:hypothetical protein
MSENFPEVFVWKIKNNAISAANILQMFSPLE